MIVPYLRSSSYAAWDWCNHRYFLEYTLGIKSPSNLKADKGNVVHKALEILARMKLANQQRREHFRDEETGEGFTVGSFDPEAAMEFAWRYYTKMKPTIHTWSHLDYKHCRNWMYHVLNHNDGQFSPLKRHIIAPEQFYDVTFDQPWAKYDFKLPDGTRLIGNLSIKGTVDLIVEGNANTIEYIDWKTGAYRRDWATGKDKDHDDLRNDPQLRMYHYALTKLYPKVKFIVMTIFYIQAGGPFSFPFDETDLAKTETMLEKRFTLIKNTIRPKLNRTWKCDRLCHFGKARHEETGQTLCEYYKDELLTLGMDKALVKHGKADAFKNYGDGGGRTDREGK